jgi:hypothetical protein
VLHLSPFPKRQGSRCRKRKLESAAIITSSPYKNQLLEKEQAKKAKVDRRQTSGKQQASGNMKSQSNRSATDVSKNPKSRPNKMTCRLDKPRGRKPQSKQRPEQKNPKGVNKKTCRRKPGTTETTADDDAACLMCSELFSSSNGGEVWIQCKECLGWCHESCSDGGTAAGYVCDFCRG